MSPPLIFSFPKYDHFLAPLIEKKLAEPGYFTVDRFQNQELHLSLQSNVEGKICFVVGSITPPEVHLFSFSVLCHTLQKEKAKKIIAILPYLAYTRQDIDEPMKSQIAPFVGDILHDAHIDEIITYDLHNDHLIKLFKTALLSIEPASIFKKYLLTNTSQEISVIAPDKGASKRAHALAKELAISKVIELHKTRTANGIVHENFNGSLGSHALIVDDILDTGETLLSCCKLLQKQGVTHIDIAVTHPLFTGSYWQELWNYGVQKIICTDTIPLSPKIASDPRIVIAPISANLSSYLEGTRYL